jgi:hypothetical protein
MDAAVTRRKARPTHREPEDIWTSPEWQAYVTDVRTNLVPKIDGSDFGVSLVPDDPAKVDVKFAVELGLLLMLDKPLLLVIKPGMELPPKLAAVADAIVEIDMADPAGQQALADAIARLIGRAQDSPGEEPDA